MTVKEETILSHKEIDIIVAVVLYTLDTMGVSGERCGTFILDWQRANGLATRVVNFDLPGGTKSEFAESSINLVLEFEGVMYSGVYSRKNLLVLNATTGRFLSSFYVDFEKDKNGVASILFATAEVLARLRQDDVVLRQSIKSTYARAKVLNYDMSAIELVGEAFRTRSLPEIRAWHNE
jgi:hypothetical protein